MVPATVGAARLALELPLAMTAAEGPEQEASTGLAARALTQTAGTRPARREHRRVRDRTHDHPHTEDDDHQSESSEDA